MLSGRQMAWAHPGTTYNLVATNCWQLTSTNMPGTRCTTYFLSSIENIQCLSRQNPTDSEPLTWSARRTGVESTAKPHFLHTSWFSKDDEATNVVAAEVLQWIKRRQVDSFGGPRKDFTNQFLAMLVGAMPQGLI